MIKYNHFKNLTNLQADFKQHTLTQHHSHMWLKSNSYTVHTADAYILSICLKPMWPMSSTKYPGKTHLQSDLSCIECDVKLYTLTHSHKLQSIYNHIMSQTVLQWRKLKSGSIIWGLFSCCTLTTQQMLITADLPTKQINYVHAAAFRFPA